MRFCIGLPNFIQIRWSAIELWRHINLPKWWPQRRKSTSGFWKQTSVILKFYFWVIPFWSFRHRHVKWRDSVSVYQFLSEFDDQRRSYDVTMVTSSISISQKAKTLRRWWLPAQQPGRWSCRWETTSRTHWLIAHLYWLLIASSVSRENFRHASINTMLKRTEKHVKVLQHAS